MTSYAIGGQGSGDFRETSARVQLLHVVTRNAQGILTPDAFTQTNPAKVPTAGLVSSTLAGITKVGVLGGSVAFTRPDYGNGFHGGPNTASYVAGCKPLGIFINDAIGNAFENTPGVASGKNPFLHGDGSLVETNVYETRNFANSADLIYVVGTPLYGSQNGLLTNENAGSAQVIIGVVTKVPTATDPFLGLQLRI